MSPCPEPDIAQFTTKFCSYEWSDSMSPEKGDRPNKSELHGQHLPNIN